jgi:hypothetical protein
LFEVIAAKEFDIGAHDRVIQLELSWRSFSGGFVLDMGTTPPKPDAHDDVQAAR